MINIDSSNLALSPSNTYQKRWKELIAFLQTSNYFYNIETDTLIIKTRDGFTTFQSTEEINFFPTYQDLTEFLIEHEVYLSELICLKDSEVGINIVLG